MPVDIREMPGYWRHPCWWIQGTPVLFLAIWKLSRMNQNSSNISSHKCSGNWILSQMSGCTLKSTRTRRQFSIRKVKKSHCQKKDIQPIPYRSHHTAACLRSWDSSTLCSCIKKNWICYWAAQRVKQNHRVLTSPASMVNQFHFWTYSTQVLPLVRWEKKTKKSSQWCLSSVHFFSTSPTIVMFRDLLIILTFGQQYYQKNSQCPSQSKTWQCNGSKEINVIL